MAAIDRIVEQFIASPLFQHVGETIADDRVQQVRNWKAAIKRRISGPGDEIYDCMLNRISTFARTTRGEEWFTENWSKSLGAVKLQIERDLKPVVDPLLRNVEHAAVVESHFYADVMEAWMIAEFPEPASKPWLDWHWRWYQAGHFPAGWQGKLPSADHRDPDRLPALYRDGTLYVY